MKYSEYKKGYSALRRILNDDELEFSRQFAKFEFTFNDRYRHDRINKGIWNTKTKNVVAFINRKGNIFVRSNSVYAQQLLGSENKVIKNDNLRGLRGKVSSTIREYSNINLIAEKASDNLIANKDKPNKVKMYDVGDETNIDVRWFIGRIKELLKDKELPNTLFALNEGTFSTTKVMEENLTKVYIDIVDQTEAIAQKERVENIKIEIAHAFVENIRDIAENSVITNTGMNPIQFTYEVDGAEPVTGVIKLNRLDMAYPPEIPIRDWLDEGRIISLIDFKERLGSLAEQGIDEMSIADRERMQQEAINQMQSHHYDRIRQSGRASIVMPRMSYAEWSTDAQWGASTAEMPTVEISREDIDRMANLAPDNIASYFWGEPEENPF